jgi:phosphohistidine phosphatase
MAAYMKEMSFEPAIVLCSSAKRARQTFAGVATGLPKGTSVEIEEDLYHSGSKDLMLRLRRLPSETPTALLIGHNPAIKDLVLALSVEDPQLDSIRAKFPTAALAVFDVPVDDWGQLEIGSAALAYYVTPKQLEE